MGGDTMHPMMRRGGLVTGMALAALLFPSVAAGAHGVRTDARQAPTHHPVVRAGQFDTWNDARPPTAVTYDQQLVPPGARAGVAAVSAPRGTVVLFVAGLLPNRTYGAHVHVHA